MARPAPGESQPLMPYRSRSQRGITPQDKGRFSGYDVLEEARRWDDVTAGVVLERLAPTTDLSFFTMREDAIATPLCDLLIAQDTEPKVPVVAMIDRRLALGETDGWRYDDMAEDAQAWRTSLTHLEEDATRAHDRSFPELSPAEQAELIQAVQDLSAAGAAWHGTSAAHVWSLWTRYVSAAFYAHPWAWNEIGFGGPAYPRGYKSRNIGGRERWEVADHDPDDPVPFADRVQRARQAHDSLVRREP